MLIFIHQKIKSASPKAMSSTLQSMAFVVSTLERTEIRISPHFTQISSITLYISKISQSISYAIHLDVVAVRYPDGRVFFSGLVQSTYQIDYNGIEFRRGVFLRSPNVIYFWFIKKTKFNFTNLFIPWHLDVHFGFCVLQKWM